MQKAIEVTQPRLVRDFWRCNRCGETPRRGVQKATGQRGLTCACRGYVVQRGTWWRQCALRERLWVDWDGNADEVNRRYWSLPELERCIYVKNLPSVQVHLSPATEISKP
jgi:hypothetical protein